MKILLLDTTKEQIGKVIYEEIKYKIKNDGEYIDAGELNISHCVGCNSCWLKTPGKCVIKDDFEPVLKKMSKADQVWLVTDTKFGFVSYKTKNIIDRVMPLVTMNLHFKGNQMRHVMRYKHNPDFGIIYSGEGDREYLTKWVDRVALNFGSRSFGAYSNDNREGAISCM